MENINLYHVLYVGVKCRSSQDILMELTHNTT